MYASADQMVCSTFASRNASNAFAASLEVAAKLQRGVRIRLCDHVSSVFIHMVK